MSNGNGYSQKRTFDLCLFSEKRIIIIGAKAHEGFTGEQLYYLKKDVSNVKNAISKKIDNEVKVNVVGLCLAKYIKNCRKTTKARFNLMISWKDLYEHTGYEPFLNADRIYKPCK